MSKRTESKERIAQALDEFIAELTTDGESSTPASIFGSSLQLGDKLCFKAARQVTGSWQLLVILAGGRQRAEGRSRKDIIEILQT